jgi:hypothetical protein
MTYTEVKQRLEDWYNTNNVEISPEVLDCCYKAICKQTSTKVTHEASLFKCCTCPDCKNVVDEFEKWGDKKVRIMPTFCRYCGQALDWTEVE